jgi:NADPH-dependent 2,4-dienoyl-CoA reductase/sulfur reductase-like enzyme
MRNLSRMLEMLRDRNHAGRPVVLVVGGGEVGCGVDALYSTQGADVLAFDIYVSPVTQFMPTRTGSRLPTRASMASSSSCARARA